MYVDDKWAADSDMTARFVRVQIPFDTNVSSFNRSVLLLLLLLPLLLLLKSPLHTTPFLSHVCFFFFLSSAFDCGSHRWVVYRYF